MRKCPHDREHAECVRCDPWRPQDATEEELVRWQKLVDTNVKWKLRVIHKPESEP